MSCGAVYPKFQISTDDEKTFVSQSTAVRKISDGEATLGTKVQESDGAVRQMTLDEAHQINILAAEWAST